jgi:hypothetical protein
MSTKGLSIQHPAVEALFENDFTIPVAELQAILALKKEAETDLLTILRDAVKNPTLYTDELAPKEGGYAPTHALLLLRELQCESVFPEFLTLLRNDVAIIDKLFGIEFITEEAWSFICHFGQDNVSDLEELLYQGETDVYSKIAISAGLAQMANHYPEKRKEIIEVFEKLLGFILDEENLEILENGESIFGAEDDYDYDIEFISHFACDLLDANTKEFEESLELLFENNLIDDDVLDEKRAVFKEYKKKHHSILEVYKNTTEAIIFDEDADKSDIDEPKIKKMKG